MASAFRTIVSAFYNGRSPSLFYAFAHQNEVKLASPAGFVSDTARAALGRLEMSRVNRGLNKARNPDYFVRIRHSVSEMGGRLQPLDDPARGQRGNKSERDADTRSDRESRKQNEMRKKRRV